MTALLHSFLTQTDQILFERLYTGTCMIITMRIIELCYQSYQANVLEH